MSFKEDWTNEHVWDYLGDRGICTPNSFKAFEIFHIHGNVLYARVKSEKERKTMGINDEHRDQYGFFDDHREDNYVVKITMDDECGVSEADEDLTREEFKLILNEHNIDKKVFQEYQSYKLEDKKRVLEFLESDQPSKKKKD